MNTQILFLGLFLTLGVGCTFGILPPPETGPPIETEPPTECTSGVNTWENFHLPHDSLSPVVVNESGYTPDLDAWNRMDTPIHLRISGEGFRIYIREGGDDSSGWLGLASVRVDGRGHILSAVVTMNRVLLDRYHPNVARKVINQEIGHLLGLGHQRNADDSAMDNCQGRGAGWLACLSSDEGTTPNEHDAEQLRIIYAHAGDGPGPPPTACGAGDGTVLVHAFSAIDGGGHGH